MIPPTLLPFALPPVLPAAMLGGAEPGRMSVLRPRAGAALHHRAGLVAMSARLPRPDHLTEIRLALHDWAGRLFHALRD